MLVGRGGGNRVHVSAQTRIDGLLEIAVGGFAGRWTGCPGGKLIEGDCVEIAARSREERSRRRTAVLVGIGRPRSMPLGPRTVSGSRVKRLRGV